LGCPAQGIILAEGDIDDNLRLTRKKIPDILAHYFNIDQDALEREKRQMLEELVEKNKQEENT
jgi:hypothetical protein